jgi:hypothetical protein
MAWETREGPNRRGRVDGAPLPHRRLVNQGSRHGQPPAWGRAWGPRGTGRDGTAYGEVQAEPARFAMAIRAGAAGHARRRTARLGPMDQERAGDWWARAAQPGRKVLRSRGQAVPGSAGHREAWGRGVPPQAAPWPWPRGGATPLARRGGGWPWRPAGGWCGPWWSARAPRSVRTGGGPASRPCPRRGGRGAPATRGPSPAPPGGTARARGGTRRAPGRAGGSPSRDESRRRMCARRRASTTAAEDPSWG